jgi:hypothetical protein
MLDIADWLYILKLEGWKQSKGIEAEVLRFSLYKPVMKIKYIKWEKYI